MPQNEHFPLAGENVNGGLYGAAVTIFHADLSLL
jgi:hypothetical protein